ncbi:MAG: alpha/beta fold hydrolase [Acidimicrobiia bacterium]
MTPTHQRVSTTDGVSLAVDVYGHDDTDRPVALLLHGGGQNRHAWNSTARRLHARGYSVAAYDARGHGDSDWDPTGGYDMEQLATDLLTVRHHIAGDRPPAVVGASMGGMTILTAHRLAPAERWAAVVLVDVTPRMEFDGVRRIIGFMAAHPDGFATLEEAADVIAAYNPHRPRPDTLDGLHKVLRCRDDGRWVWRWDPAFITSKLDAVDADPTRIDAIADVLLDGTRRITAPTLLVRGALSDLVSHETVAEFLDVVPHAETIDVSGTGHMVAGDDNDAFTAAVAEFLARTATTGGPE